MDHSRRDDGRRRAKPAAVAGAGPGGPRSATRAGSAARRSAFSAALLLLLASPLARVLLAGAPISRIPTPVQPIDQTRNAPGRKILGGSELGKEQFRFRLRALTNDQLVDWKGQRLTKLAFLAAAGRRIKTTHLQAVQQAAPHGQAELAAARARFSAEEAARLAARNEQARNAAQQRIAEALAARPAAPGPGASGSGAPGSQQGIGGSGSQQGSGAPGSATGPDGTAGLRPGSGPAAPGSRAEPAVLAPARPLLAASGIAASPAAVAGAAAEDPTACAPPRIAYAPPFALSPGSYVAVVGCGFGAAAPREWGLVLKLQTDGVEVPLVVKEWHDEWITASVPAGLAGLPDQGAQLVVRAAAGESAGWLVPFRAARELRALRAAEVPVERCASTADANYCNHEARLDPGYWGLLDKSGLGNPAEPFSSAAGYHADDASPNEDRGVDVYHLHLGHGWSLAGFTFHYDAVPGVGAAAPPQAFEPGYAEQVLMVPWAVNGEGAVTYYLDLFATGPRGTNP
jgi:hypothetical protein